MEYKIEFNKRVFNKIQIPVIDLKIFNNYYSFLVDSGANNSIIDINLYNELKNKYSIIEKQGNVSRIGIGGEQETINTICLCLNINNKDYLEEFNIDNLSNICNYIKNEAGLVIEGIIGTKIMRKYNWIIDFQSEYILIQ